MNETQTQYYSSSIKELSSFTQCRYNSVKDINYNNIIQGDCEIDFNFEKIYLVLQFNNEITHKVKYATTMFDKMKNNKQDILNRTMMYL